MEGEVRIGASGWHYKHWRGPFYDPALPPREMLAYYVQHFDTVEINECGAIRRRRGSRAKLKHIDMYFDNDQEAFAVRNALELKTLIPSHGPGR